MRLIDGRKDNIADELNVSPNTLYVMMSNDSHIFFPYVGSYTTVRTVSEGKLRRSIRYQNKEIDEPINHAEFVEMVESFQDGVKPVLKDGDGI